MRPHRTRTTAALALLCAGSRPSRRATAKRRSSPKIRRSTAPTSTCSAATSRAATDYVTLIANYLPLQDAVRRARTTSPSIPTRSTRSTSTTTATPREDLTFQFRFKNDAGRRRHGHRVPMRRQEGGRCRWSTSARSAPPTPPSLNVLETYTLRRGARRPPHRRRGKRSPTPTAARRPSTSRSTTSAPRRIARLRRLRRPAHLPHQHPRLREPGRVFVGQRKEPFAVNLGAIFDLVNAPPRSVIDATAAPADAVPSTIDDKNVTSLVLELPIACLTAGRASDVIGGWTTASLRQARVLNPRAALRPPAGDRGRRLDAGLAPRHAARQRGRHRPQGQGPLQRQRAEGRRPVRRLRHQPDAARAARGAVRRRRRDGADQLPAHRPGRGLPHRRRRA